MWETATPLDGSESRWLSLVAVANRRTSKACNPRLVPGEPVESRRNRITAGDHFDTGPARRSGAKQGYDQPRWAAVSSLPRKNANLVGPGHHYCTHIRRGNRS